MSKRKIGSPGFLLALALIFIFVAMNMLPYCFHHGAIERARRVGCASNLKQIGLGIKMYASDNGKAFPVKFVEAGQYWGYHPELFICRESGNEPGAFETVDEWTDYVYVSGLAESSPEDAVLAYCDPKNHDNEGGNILFLDGHIEWFNSKRSDDDRPSFGDMMNKIREQRKP